jgi:hypothetical protein
MDDGVRAWQVVYVDVLGLGIGSGWGIILLLNSGVG